MELQDQEVTTFLLASIAKQLVKWCRTDATDATSTQKRTNTDKVGKNGLWNQKESLSTMNEMWGRIKQ